MDNINVFTDGASRGNPGLSGIGVVIYNGKKKIKEISTFLGKKTNNEAEYSAVIIAIKNLIELDIKKANIFSDSQFLVKQLNGEYKVKSENIIPLFEKAKGLLENIKINFTWIPREDNIEADALANLGIDNLQTAHKIKLNDDENNKIKNLNAENNFKNKSINSNQMPIKLKLNRAFFGQINCLKIQLNLNNELYFHMGLLNKKSNSWSWEKVKMNDNEVGEIVNLLRKDEGKCSFFHSFENNKTQIWCNKNKTGFSIKIKTISKNLSVGESEVLRIILEKAIIIKNYEF